MGLEQYRVVIRFDDENKNYVAVVPELPLMPAVTADSRAEVIAKLDEAMETGAKLTVENNGELPKAIDEDDSFDGQLTVNIGKSLHRDLAFKAKKEGIDLDKALIAAVAAYVNGGRRSFNNNHRHEEKRDENIDGNSKNYESRRFVPREGSAEYRTLMDDSATFREYLRQQERSSRPQRGNRNRRNFTNNNAAATNNSPAEEQ